MKTLVVTIGTVIGAGMLIASTPGGAADIVVAMMILGIWSLLALVSLFVIDRYWGSSL